ncbi:MAG: hypothetical protein HYZ83_06830 [Candidatus Omnitrophica bacterium]|nr:hypothetical protein [Candidatus Omnitrophota bacterium]
MFDIRQIQLRAARSRYVLSGFRFRSTEEALSYGTYIKNDKEKIDELVKECEQVADQCKNIPPQEKMIVLTKLQLLREAIHEAQKAA